MSSPLIRMLIEDHGYATVTEENVDAFLAGNDFSVLFFPGDPERMADSNDVAVILPELMKVFGEIMVPAVVDRESERALQLRFRFNSFPTLVFLRGDGYLGALSQVKDWSVYLEEISAMLAKDPGAPPPYRFPDGCQAAGAPQ